MQSILGQDRAIEILTRAIDAERIHHAWIFSGPVGVGKFTTALELAKILLDPAAGPNLAGQVEADPDGETVRLVDAGTHPDLHVIRKELALLSENAQLRGRRLTNIPLDVLREHMLGGKTSDDRNHEAPAYRTPVQGRAKVFIIDEAELVDRNGQNAMLKTLEEPPASTYLILVTARPERLLPTVHSRCQHVRFGTLDDDAMDAWIDRASLDLDDDDRAWIARFCAGSPGLACRAIEYGFAGWRERLGPHLASLRRGEFPTGLGVAMAELVDEFAATWVKKHKNASKEMANKDGARHLLALLTTMGRERLAAACAAGEDPQATLTFIDVLRQAERRLESNVNMKLVLEGLAAGWYRVRTGTEAHRH